MVPGPGTVQSSPAVQKSRGKEDGGKKGEDHREDLAGSCAKKPRPTALAILEATNPAHPDSTSLRSLHTFLPLPYPTSSSSVRRQAPDPHPHPRPYTLLPLPASSDPLLGSRSKQRGLCEVAIMVAPTLLLPPLPETVGAP